MFDAGGWISRSGWYKKVLHRDAEWKGLHLTFVAVFFLAYARLEKKAWVAQQLNTKIPSGLRMRKLTCSDPIEHAFVVSLGVPSPEEESYVRLLLRHPLAI